jgi:hypothetical protein
MDSWIRFARSEETRKPYQTGNASLPNVPQRPARLTGATNIPRYLGRTWAAIDATVSDKSDKTMAGGPIARFALSIHPSLRELKTRACRMPRRARRLSTGEAWMKSILDPSFRYVRSDKTDIRKTFARIRRQNALAQGDYPEASASNGRPGTVIVQLDRPGLKSA